MSFISFAMNRAKEKPWYMYWKHFFLNIEYVKSLSNESVNDTNNLEKLTEKKGYSKTTMSFKIVAKNLG